MSIIPSLLKSWKTKCNKVNAGIKAREFVNDVASLEKTTALVGVILKNYLSTESNINKAVEKTRKDINKILNDPKAHKDERITEVLDSDLVKSVKKDIKTRVAKEAKDKAEVQQIIKQASGDKVDKVIKQNRIKAKKRKEAEKSKKTNNSNIIDYSLIPEIKDEDVKVFVGKATTDINPYSHLVDRDNMYREDDIPNIVFKVPEYKYDENFEVKIFVGKAKTDKYPYAS